MMTTLTDEERERKRQKERNLIDKHPEENPEDNFSSDLFIDKNYVKKSFTFGNETVDVMLLESAATDYNLTGQVIWRAAWVLSNYIVQNQSFFKNKKVLEVGSGIGLCGVLVSRFAKETYLTDYEDIVLEVLQDNVDLNKAAVLECYCKKLDWMKQSTIDDLLTDANGPFDVIIGSDVVYWKSSIQPLLTTVSSLLKKESEAQFILCYQSRASLTDDYLLQQCNEFGFDYEFIKMQGVVSDKEDIGDPATKNVHLLILQRKKIN